MTDINQKSTVNIVSVYCILKFIFFFKEKKLYTFCPVLSRTSKVASRGRIIVLLQFICVQRPVESNASQVMVKRERNCFFSFMRNFLKC